MDDRLELLQEALDRRYTRSAEGEWRPSTSRSSCTPCGRLQSPAARDEEASDDEIRQAVDDALTVRTSATETMLRVVEYLGVGKVLDERSRSPRPLLSELTSVAAATAFMERDQEKTAAKV